MAFIEQFFLIINNDKFVSFYKTKPMTVLSLF